jgi:hypothetical protein
MIKNEKDNKTTKDSKLNTSGSSAQASHSEDTSSDNENYFFNELDNMRNATNPKEPLKKRANRSASSSSFLIASGQASQSSYFALNTADKQNKRRRSIFDYMNEEEDESFNSEYDGISELLMPSILAHKQHANRNKMRQILSADNVRLQQQSLQIPLVQVSFASDDRITDGAYKNLVIFKSLFPM